MFGNQTDTFRERQWSGWKRFLKDFIRRESVRTAWQLSKETYDTNFQAFMDRKIAAVLTEPAPVAAAKSPFAPLPSALPLAAPASTLDLPLETAGASAGTAAVRLSE